MHVLEQALGAHVWPGLCEHVLEQALGARVWPGACAHVLEQPPGFVSGQDHVHMS